MTDHRRTLVLAATAIDWELGAAEKDELEEHLASCTSCARSAQALRQDATRMRTLPENDAPERVRSIVRDATLDRSRLPHRSRLLLVAAALLLLAALIGGTVAVGALVRYFDRFAVAPLPTSGPVVPSTAPRPSPSPVPITSVELTGSNGSKIRLDIVDQSRSLVEARSPTLAELNSTVPMAEGNRIGIANNGSPNVLKVLWAGGCDSIVTLTVDPDIRRLLFVNAPAPPQECDAIAIQRGVILTLSRSIPADSIAVAMIDAGPTAPVASRADAGLAWARTPIQAAFANAEVTSVTAGGPGLVAVGKVSGFAAVWTSRDGHAWSRVPHTAAFEFAEMTDVTAGPNGLVAVGFVPDSRPAAWTSTDGLRWERAPESATFAAGGAMRHVAAGGLGVVAAGGGTVWFSTDGRAWERVFEATAISDLIVGGPGFVAVGCDLDQGGAQCVRPRAWISADGRTWLDASPIGDPSLGGLKRVVASRLGLVALGSAAAHDNPVSSIWISADGKTWRQAAGGSALEGGSAQLVVAGGPGVVLLGGTGNGAGPIAAWTSPDGRTWTQVADTSAFGSVAEVFAVAATEDSIAVIGRSEIAGPAGIRVWISPPEGS